ncbi:MAG: hypothetical protein LJF06_16660 [Gemmatimonadetes bacterium]|nr:hypothetical protein [Gemmatimonadota bacterium]
MKRFPFILLAVSVVAVAACQGTKTPSNGPPGTTGATGTAEAPPPPGHVNVNVSCDTAVGMGVRVRPWRVNTNRSDTLTWNLTPASDSMPTTLSPVVDSLWPFDSASYTWYRRTQSIPVKADADTITYRYRLTIVCPTATIVIDPEIIVN